MSEEPEKIDWTGVSEKTARQILDQGEKFMQAQLQAALAADSRATTMASIFVTVALAVLAGGLGYWDKASSAQILIAGCVCGCLLLLAAAFAAWAARPIDFYFPGNQPHQWFPVRTVSIVKLLGGEAQNYDERIAYNDERLSENQRAIRRSFWIAIGSPLAGAAAYWLTLLICSSCRA